MTYMAQTTSKIPDWSLNGVVLYAQDDQESKAYSLKVNFLVRAVSFTVERVDSGPITVNDPAEFQGEGLPNSLVIARYADGNAKLNSTRVLADGSWSMQITANQMVESDGSKDVIFEMDGQVYSFAGQTEDAKFSLSVSSGDEGGFNIMIVLIVLGVIALLAAGAFFFIEFEEVPDEDDLTSDDSEPEEDPYAWAKAREAAAAPEPTPAPAASQHPGWLWDQASNQWVPDPDYQQPPQQ